MTRLGLSAGTIQTMQLVKYDDCSCKLDSLDNEDWAAGAARVRGELCFRCPHERSNHDGLGCPPRDRHETQGHKTRRHVCNKPFYRFVGRSGDVYYWEARMPGDSRVEQIRCNVAWFWKAD